MIRPHLVSLSDFSTMRRRFKSGPGGVPGMAFDDLSLGPRVADSCWDDICINKDCQPVIMARFDRPEGSGRIPASRRTRTLSCP